MHPEKELRQYGLLFAERLLIAAGCTNPIPYKAMVAQYLHLEPDGADVTIAVVDPETGEPKRHPLFAQPYSVQDLLDELAARHPAIAPNLRRH